MMDIVFTSPMGGEMKNPSLEMLRDRILYDGSEYWCVGSGSGSCEAKINSETVILSLILKEPYGFLLRYVASCSTDEFVSISSADYSVTVQAWLCGEPWVVPAAFFVSRDQAWQAVEDFCRSGQMSELLTWGRLDEQEWDFGT